MSYYSSFTSSLYYYSIIIIISLLCFLINLYQLYINIEIKYSYLLKKIHICLLLSTILYSIALLLPRDSILYNIIAHILADSTGILGYTISLFVLYYIIINAYFLDTFIIEKYELLYSNVMFMLWCNIIISCIVSWICILLYDNIMYYLIYYTCLIVMSVILIISFIYYFNNVETYVNTLTKDILKSSRRSSNSSFNPIDKLNTFKNFVIFLIFTEFIFICFQIYLICSVTILKPDKSFYNNSEFNIGALGPAIVFGTVGCTIFAYKRNPEELTSTLPKLTNTHRLSGVFKITAQFESVDTIETDDIHIEIPDNANRRRSSGNRTLFPPVRRSKMNLEPITDEMYHLNRRRSSEVMTAINPLFSTSRSPAINDIAGNLNSLEVMKVINPLFSPSRSPVITDAAGNLNPFLKKDTKVNSRGSDQITSSSDGSNATVGSNLSSINSNQSISLSLTQKNPVFDVNKFSESDEDLPVPIPAVEELSLVHELSASKHPSILIKYPSITIRPSPKASPSASPNVSREASPVVNPSSTPISLSSLGSLRIPVLTSTSSTNKFTLEFPPKRGSVNSPLSNNSKRASVSLTPYNRNISPLPYSNDAFETRRRTSSNTSLEQTNHKFNKSKSGQSTPIYYRNTAPIPRLNSSLNNFDISSPTVNPTSLNNSVQPPRGFIRINTGTLRSSQPELLVPTSSDSFVRMGSAPANISGDTPQSVLSHNSNISPVISNQSIMSPVLSAQSTYHPTNTPINRNKSQETKTFKLRSPNFGPQTNPTTILELTKGNDGTGTERHRSSSSPQSYDRSRTSFETDSYVSNRSKSFTDTNEPPNSKPVINITTPNTIISVISPSVSIPPE